MDFLDMVSYPHRHDFRTDIQVDQQTPQMDETTTYFRWNGIMIRSPGCKVAALNGVKKVNLLSI